MYIKKNILVRTKRKIGKVTLGALLNPAEPSEPTTADFKDEDFASADFATSDDDID